MATLIFYLDDGTSMTHVLEGETTTVGRHPDSVIVLDCPSVSGHHAIIQQQEDGFYVSDQASSNGTRINGAEIEEAKLSNGDRVGFGDIQSVYYAGDVPEAVASANELVIEVPPPQIPVKEPTPPLPPADYRTKPARRNRAVSRVSGYPDTTESGCMTALIVISLFIAAFIGGLYMRHYKDTEGGNFFSDLFGKLGGSLPKIKIEKTIEK